MLSAMVRSTAPAEELIDRSSEQAFPFWESFGRCIAGRALVHQSAGAAGAELVQRGVAALKTMGMGNFYAVSLPWAAEVIGAVRHAQEGLAGTGGALSLLDVIGQRCAEAELLLIQGTLLEQLGSHADDAQAWYLKAIEVACRQQTKLLELRSARA